MDGKPLQIISFDGDQLVQHRSNLELVVTKCNKLPLVIYSAAGKFREGKSFLLNLLLLFNKNKTNGTDWKYDSNKVSGFDARPGSDRVTSGVWIWSEPIIVTNSNGHKYAVLLIDTQGTFDTGTTTKVNGFIFGFAIAVSSVTVYNVKDRISTQELDHLLVFADCFKSIDQEFQSLLFLVRDWLDKEKYAFGSDGGDRYINDLFKPVDGQLGRTREMIKMAFKDIAGLLLPRPGEAAIESRNGVTVDQLNPDFVESVDELCARLFVTNVNGKKTGTNLWTENVLLESFDKMVHAYIDGKVVDPGTFAEANSRRMADYFYLKSLDGFMKSMAAIIDNAKKISPIDVKTVESSGAEQKAQWFSFLTQNTAAFGHFVDLEKRLAIEMDQWLKQQRELINQINQLAEEKRQKDIALAQKREAEEKAEKERYEAAERQKKHQKELEHLRQRDRERTSDLERAIAAMSAMAVNSRPEVHYIDRPVFYGGGGDYGGGGSSCSGGSYDNGGLAVSGGACGGMIVANGFGEQPVKRGPGRPLGSKNKPKPEVPDLAPPEIVKRGPGRPLGSKNKPKPEAPVLPPPEPVKRGPGRPLGSKNKPKAETSINNFYISSSSVSSASASSMSSPAPAPARRGPGRPPGSKNKP